MWCFHLQGYSSNLFGSWSDTEQKLFLSHRTLWGCFGHTQVQEAGRRDRSVLIRWKLRFPETANFVGPTTTICGNNTEVNALWSLHVIKLQWTEIILQSHSAHYFHISHRRSPQKKRPFLQNWTPTGSVQLYPHSSRSIPITSQSPFYMITPFTLFIPTCSVW
jgi:hypothetical protein